eukprot:12039040-Alexandrium_andersonii.AAC.1
MSASLVGSEMCIRDRALVHSDCSATRQTQQRHQACANMGCLGANGIFAVSYTHLTLPTICSV